jgi:hypothetical protein
MTKILKIIFLINYLIIVINNKDLTPSDIDAASTDPIDSVYDDDIIKKITVDVNIIIYIKIIKYRRAHVITIYENYHIYVFLAVINDKNLI